MGAFKVLSWLRDARSTICMFISQNKYIEDLLVDTGMSERSPCKTPIVPGCKLSAATDDVF